MKSVIAYVLAFFECCVVSLVAFAAVKFFESVAFALLFVVNLVRFTNRNAFFNHLIILFIILARDTSRNILYIMSIFRTRFTLISQLIPHRSQLWARLTTTTLSINNRLINWTSFTQLINRIPSGLIFGTHADTLAGLVAGLNSSQTDTFIGFLVELVSLLAGADSLSE